VQALVADEAGQGLVEYGLIIGLVAIALVGVLGTLTGALQAVFNNISRTLNPTGG
jgi:pilus assembly protein Flp/PilA